MPLLSLWIILSALCLVNTVKNKPHVITIFRADSSNAQPLACQRPNVKVPTV